MWAIEHWGVEPDLMTIAKAIASGLPLSAVVARDELMKDIYPGSLGGTYGGNPNGYLVYIEDRCIYAAGDTCPFAEMAWIGEENDVDVALLPIGDCFTMGLKGSVRAARMVQPKLTIPIHYDTFPLIEVDTDRWAALMVKAGFATRVLAPGETLAS